MMKSVVSSCWSSQSSARTSFKYQLKIPIYVRKLFLNQGMEWGGGGEIRNLRKPNVYRQNEAPSNPAPMVFKFQADFLDAEASNH